MSNKKRRLKRIAFNKLRRRVHQNDRAFREQVRAEHATTVMREPFMNVIDEIRAKGFSVDGRALLASLLADGDDA
jgi:hypothetical protein